jgi:hypothetical protein
MLSLRKSKTPLNSFATNPSNLAIVLLYNSIPVPATLLRLKEPLTVGVIPKLPRLLFMSTIRSLRAQTALSRNRSPDLRESSSGSPTHTLTRNLNLSIQLVDLLKGKTLRLIDHHVNEGNTQKAASEPDEEDLGLEICITRAPIDEIGCGVGDRPVQEPVGGRSHRERLGSDFEREDLAGNDPGDGAPGRGEEEDVDADEGDGCLLSSEILGEDGPVCVLAC